MLSNKDKAFIEEFWGKIKKKVSLMADETGANFPITAYDTGKYDPYGKDTSVSDWTVGFWPGMLWLMYLDTKDEKYRKIAEECEVKLDKAFDDFLDIHHDVGFMWSLSALADYKLTGNERSRARALHAATILAGRYNFVGKYIRAWEYGCTKFAIIDCMMNIPLLHWASAETKDPRFAFIANSHADTVLEHFIRPDGSVAHIVSFDPEGIEAPTVEKNNQGYSADSSWTRGQGWAVYGFALAYLNTGKKEYLDAAKRVAHYFIANMDDTWIPPCDFRSPKEPLYLDTSAGAVCACGLIEIAKCVPELERGLYLDAAMNMLRALDKQCNYTEEDLSLLQNGTISYHAKTGQNTPLIYGSYYMMEAIAKLRGDDGRFSVHNG